MHIDLYGDALNPALVLFHGSGAPAASLEQLVAMLSATHRVLVPHYPGYGSTPAQADPADLDAATRQCLDALDDLQVQRFVAVGHSLGFYRAQRVLSHAPERVTSLLGLSGVASLPEQARPGYEGLAALARGGHDIPSLLLASWFTPAYAAAQPSLLDLLRQWWAQCDVETVIAELFIPIDGGAHDRLMAQVSCPVHMLHGASDAAAPLGLALAIQALSPHIQLTQLPDVGHFTHLEAPAQTAAWLQRVLAT